MLSTYPNVVPSAVVFIGPIHFQWDWNNILAWSMNRSDRCSNGKNFNHLLFLFEFSVSFEILNALVNSHVQLHFETDQFSLWMLIYFYVLSILRNYSFSFHYKILKLKVNFELENNVWNTKSVKWPWQFCPKIIASILI